MPGISGKTAGVCTVSYTHLDVYKRQEMTAEWNELVSAQITGKERIFKGETGIFTAESLPTGLDGLSLSLIHI